MKHPDHKLLIVITSAILGILIFVGIFFIGFATGRHITFTDMMMRQQMGGDFKNKPGPQGFWKNFNKGGFGVRGRVMEVAGDFLVVQGREGVDKTVRITEETEFRKGKEEVSLEDIAVNEEVIVVGRPGEDGEIEAKVVQFRGARGVNPTK